MGCIILFNFLLLIAAQGYSVQSANYENDVPEIKSMTAEISNPVNDSNYERHGISISETHEDYATNEKRGRRVKRDWKNFKASTISGWNAFCVWLKNNWSKITGHFRTLKP